MAQSAFTLPGGIRLADGRLAKDVEFREMTGEEEDILADMRREHGKKGKFAKHFSQRFTEILSRCTVRLGDMSRADGTSSPSFFEAAWAGALSLDRAFAIIRLRGVSLGEKYVFSAKCDECEHEMKRLTLDLAALEVQPIPDECQGVEFIDEVCPSGLKVRWRMLTGKDEPRIDETMDRRKADFVSALLYLRLVSVNDEPVEFEHVKKMSTRDRRFLVQQFDVKEGGIDTDIENVCEECSASFWTKLNVGNVNFFFPSET